MLNGLDLFSGIGGITLGLQKWVTPIAYCEIDEYARAVLLSRMHQGQLPVAPIWDDVTTLGADLLPTPIDIIYGGFPCQDISVAGRGEGLAGERSELFFEILRLAKEIKSKFIFLENVPAIRLRGLNTVGQELASAGYDCRWDYVSAAEIGAPHLRKRWFLLAHSNGSRVRDEQRRSSGKGRQGAHELSNNGQKESMAHANEPRPQGACEKLEQQEAKRETESSIRPNPRSTGWWETEPNVGRVVDGVPFRVDRIKALGNAVIPAQVSEAFERLIGYSPRSNDGKAK